MGFVLSIANIFHANYIMICSYTLLSWSLEQCVYIPKHPVSFFLISFVRFFLISILIFVYFIKSMNKSTVERLKHGSSIVSMVELECSRFFTLFATVYLSWGDSKAWHNSARTCRFSRSGHHSFIGNKTRKMQKK